MQKPQFFVPTSFFLLPSQPTISHIMSSSFSCSVQFCRLQASTYSFLAALKAYIATKIDTHQCLPVQIQILSSQPVKRSSKYPSAPETWSMIISSSDSIVNWNREQGEDTGESTQHQSTVLYCSTKCRLRKPSQVFTEHLYFHRYVFAKEVETLQATCVQEGLYESPPMLQCSNHELLLYRSSVLN